MPSISYASLESDKISPMESAITQVRPIGIADIWVITRMTFANMTGVDRYFTYVTRNPLSRWLYYPKLMLDLSFAGKGYKAVRGKAIVGCAYVHFYSSSAFVFNVMVNRPYRRQGVGTQLMALTERVAQKHQRAWMALYVDDGNLPARRMYERLGYRAYHPHYFVWEGNRPIHKAIPTGLTLQPLRRYQGRQLFARYLDLERQSGDQWTAKVLDDYTTWTTIDGDFYRCSLYGDEFGCASVAGNNKQLQIKLATDSNYWGHITLAGLIKLLAETKNMTGGRAEVYLMSSAHHQAALPGLVNLNFRQASQRRILMLKSLTDMDQIR
jgi:ribosomal protein S18 acetylase RimI-like enzyme